jgi:hypothetical protein
MNLACFFVKHPAAFRGVLRNYEECGHEEVSPNHHITVHDIKYMGAIDSMLL